MSGKYVNALVPGSRVWTESGLHEHGHKKVSVPALTGGTVRPFSGDNLFAVKWDTGQESVQYSSELLSIGNARNLSEFMEMIKSEAVKVRKVLGPLGGDRGFVVFLRSGDMFSGAPYCFASLLASLEKAGIPVEIERVEKKKRQRDEEVEADVKALLDRIARNSGLK